MSDLPAWIAAIAAIAAPSVTALINNIHQTRMYKRKMYTQHKIEVIESYIAACGERVFSITYESYPRFCAEIFLYVPKCYWHDIEKLNEQVNKKFDERDNKLSLSLLSKVSQELSLYLEKSRK